MCSETSNSITTAKKNAERENRIVTEILVERRTLAMPLSQLKSIAEADKETREAIEDWHYWVAQGYEL